MSNDDEIIDVEVGDIDVSSSKHHDNNSPKKENEHLVVNEASENYKNDNNSALFNIQKKNSKIIHDDHNKTGNYYEHDEHSDHNVQSHQSPKKDENTERNEITSEEKNASVKSNISAVKSGTEGEHIPSYSNVVDYEAILKSLANLTVRKHPGEKLTKWDKIDNTFRVLLEYFQEVLIEEEHWIKSQKKAQDNNDDKIINNYAKQNNKLLHLLSQLNILLNSLIELVKVTPKVSKVTPKKKIDSKKKLLEPTETDIKISYFYNNEKIEGYWKTEFEKVTKRFQVISQPDYLIKCSDISENLDRQIKELKLENRQLQKSNTISENRNDFRMKHNPDQNMKLRDLDFSYTNLRKFNDDLQLQIQKQNNTLNDKKEILKLLEEERDNMMAKAKELGLTEQDIETDNDDSQIKLKLITLLKKHAIYEKQLSTLKKKSQIKKEKMEEVVADLRTKIEDAKLMVNEKKKVSDRNSVLLKKYYKLYNQQYYELIYGSMEEKENQNNQDNPVEVIQEEDHNHDFSADLSKERVLSPIKTHRTNQADSRILVNDGLNKANNSKVFLTANRTGRHSVLAEELHKEALSMEFNNEEAENQMEKEIWEDEVGRGELADFKTNSPKRSVPGSPHKSNYGSPKKSVTGSPVRNGVNSPKRNTNNTAFGKRSQTEMASSPKKSLFNSPRRGTSQIEENIEIIEDTGEQGNNYDNYVDNNQANNNSPKKSNYNSPAKSVKNSPIKSVQNSPTKSVQNSPSKSKFNDTNNPKLVDRSVNMSINKTENIEDIDSINIAEEDF